MKKYIVRDGGNLTDLFFKKIRHLCICAEFPKFSVYTDINMSSHVLLIAVKLKCKLCPHFLPHPMQVRLQFSTTVLLSPQILCMLTWSRLIADCRRFGTIFRHHLINHQPTPSSIHRRAPNSCIRQVFKDRRLQIPVNTNTDLPNTTNIRLQKPQNKNYLLKWWHFLNKQPSVTESIDVYWKTF